MESPTPSITASPTFSNGLELQKLAKIDMNCEQDYEMDPAVISYFAKCNDNVLIEFGPYADLEKTTKAVTDSYLKYLDYDPWLISDEWMIKSHESHLLPIMEEYPDATLFIQEGGSPSSADQLSEMMSAIEEVSGSSCVEVVANEYDAMRKARCDDSQGELYTLAYVFPEATERKKIIDGGVELFSRTNHDAYAVTGLWTYIHDVPLKDAKEISKNIKYSEVINLNGYSLVE